ncbi:hypothetical protein [Halobaculum sp. D14]|uniref:hypothetical protein n=1 Tax=unclassified Halobaculum TaxID=2640896 RepID=UPI003EBEE992
MSTSNQSPADRLARHATDAPAVVRDAAQTGLLQPARAAAFWTASLLPLTYLPLLAAGVAGSHTTAFAALVAVNVVAAVAGHDYEP